MSVTLKDIALQVGKSVTTVSRALNGYDDVGVDTKAEIIRIAKEMGYRPNTLAQRLQKRRTDTIGLIIPTSPGRAEDPFFTELLTSIGNKASLLGYDLLVSTQPPGDPELSAYRRMLEGRQVDGFILARTRLQDERIEYLSKQNFPFVVFGRVEERNNFPFVDVDGEYGMRLIADHLFKAGCRNIACIAVNPQYAFALCRKKGLQDRLADLGLILREENIKIGDLSQRSGYEKAKELLSQPNPPDAIAACNDLMALGVLRAVQEAGLVVGKDVCVTGFDDIPMAEHSHPPLTTIHQPINIVGALICEMLVHSIRDEKMAQVHVVLEPSLVGRQSCGEMHTRN